MRQTSDLWKRIMAGTNFLVETVLIINGKEYTPTTAPSISRTIFSGSPNIGGALTASLNCTLAVPTTEIPRSAEVVVKQRPYDPDIGQAEWIDPVTFFLSKRSNDKITGILSLTCYDSMRMAQAQYFSDPSERDDDDWPQSMAAVALQIAAKLGVEMDSRTVMPTGDEYIVPIPAETVTMMALLQDIGEAFGGNWVITEDNKLRLLTFADPPSKDTDLRLHPEILPIIAVTSKFTISEEKQITGIRATTAANVPVSRGDEDGMVLDLGSNPYITEGIMDDLYEKLGGITYRPYSMSSALYDPAAELGDPMVYPGLIGTYLYTETLTCAAAQRGNISAASRDELDDEFPYAGVSSSGPVYVYFKYAPVQNPTAAQMKDTPDVYIGTCTSRSRTAPADPAAYVWARLRGDDAKATLVMRQSSKRNKTAKTVTGTASIWSGDTDVTAEYPASWLSWYTVTEAGTEFVEYGPTVTVPESSFPLGGSLRCIFQTRSAFELLIDGYVAVLDGFSLITSIGDDE